jgi:hypothetical protein
LQPDTVPYFLWDSQMTIGELKQALQRADRVTTDELIARILREANSRDVWLFLEWSQIEEAWPRVQHRLGRARQVWQMLLDRRHHHQAGHGAATPPG